MVHTNLQFNQIYKRGYVSFKISDQLLDEIKQDTDRLIKNNFQGLQSYSQTLVGNVGNEFRYETFADQLVPYLRDATDLYYENYNTKLNENIWYNYCHVNKSKDMWINFQTKNEFNPPHSHVGTLSFVLWINIPYDVSEELEHLESKNIKNIVEIFPGAFRFMIPDHFCRSGILTNNIHVDKTFEGRGILFESGTTHMVNPFYCSDGYRISIAGNLNFPSSHNE